MRLEAIDPIGDPRWLELVERAHGASVFHHPAWLELLRDQYGYALSAWCLPGPEGGLAAGLPVALVSSRLTGRRLVALPFSDVCPVLRDPSAPAGVMEGALDAERRAAGLDLEVRAAVPGDGAGHPVVRHVTHRLALSEHVADVEAGFSKSQVKRGVKKALREGVVVERRTDPDALARFYRLHAQTRRRQGVPTQPRRFIMRFSELFDRGLGFVLLALVDGRDAAAAVFLAAAGTLTYKYGASDPSMLRSRPNNLLFMEAIRWGCEHGQRTLDFGRTDLENEGLRAFKSAWGAEEEELPYTYFSAHAPSGGNGRAQRAMGAVIRRAPPFVSRWTGEALYRHFG